MCYSLVAPWCSADVVAFAGRGRCMLRKFAQDSSKLTSFIYIYIHIHAHRYTIRRVYIYICSCPWLPKVTATLVCRVFKEWIARHRDLADNNNDSTLRILMWTLIESELRRHSVDGDRCLLGLHIQHGSLLGVVNFAHSLCMSVCFIARSLLPPKPPSVGRSGSKAVICARRYQWLSTRGLPDGCCRLGKWQVRGSNWVAPCVDV
jgi:hypothetical protein